MLAIRFAVLLFALLLDRFIGDPVWLWSRLPHPVALFGTVIGFLDKRLNRAEDSARQQRRNGIAAIVLSVAAAIITGLAIAWLFRVSGLFGALAEIVLVAVFLAQKSLADHVESVSSALRDGGLPAGRAAVSLIVGRDPESLDAAGVSRAAIESLAENFSDGVVAPAFWYVALGMPGLLAYKMINTADSMVGHKNSKYLSFGWASARLDDAANIIPARLSIVFLSLGAWKSSGFTAAKRALRIALADHAHHRSPNSGWPEAAMAGALDLQLAGPRVYGAERVCEPWLNAAGSGNAGPDDIEGGVGVFYNACLALTGLTAAALVLSL